MNIQQMLLNKKTVSAYLLTNREVLEPTEVAELEELELALTAEIESMSD